MAFWNHGSLPGMDPIAYIMDPITCITLSLMWGLFVNLVSIGNCTRDPTARSTYAQQLHDAQDKGAFWVLRGGLKNSNRNLDRVSYRHILQYLMMSTNFLFVY